jgi:type I restriction enzyme, R subunit
MTGKAPPKSSNFGFLAKHYPQLELIGARGERYFSADPVVTLISVRQFGEVLAQLVAARSGLFSEARETQADLLRRLRVDGNYPRSVLDLFHQIRIHGNPATHQGEGDHATALACLKIARQLAIWFYRTFDDHKLKAGPFQPPRPPIDATAELTTELDRLKAERDAALTAAERAKAAAAEAEAARLDAERGAKGAVDEKTLWEQLAAEAEAAARVNQSRPQGVAGRAGSARFLGNKNTQRLETGEERGHRGFYCRLHSSGGPRRPSRSVAGSCACCDDTYN